MSKRGNGEGSIYQMADGRWRGAVSVGWKNNEQGETIWKRKVVTARTRYDVQESMKQILRDQQRGLPISVDRQTVGQFLNEWLEDTARTSVRPKTYRSYEQMLRNHLVKGIPQAEWKKKGLDSVAGLGSVQLSKLTLQVVQKFLNAKLAAGNSPALVRYLRVVLRIALNHAVKNDFMARNPAALATPPRVEKTEIQPFAPEEAVRFLKAAQGHRLEALFTTALAVGLRSGEASGLRWPDVDFEKGTITVRNAIQRIKGKGLVLVPPKSEDSRRVIDLPEVCLKALRAHQQRQRVEREWAGTRWKETGHVFTSGIGTPLDDRRVLLEFTRLVEAAKLPKQRFHDLRHACISLLAAQGVPVKVISRIVGHSDIRLTQNIYEHVYQPARKDAASRMNDFLTEATEPAPNPVATTVATKAVSGMVN